MKHLKIGYWVSALVLILVFSSTTRADEGRVVFILDGSNSMWGRIDGTEKIVVARDVLSEVLSELPSDMQVGVAAYGHRRESACDDIETILPVGNHSQSAVEEAIRGVQPRGMTPISAALEHVAGGLEDQLGRTHLVLVSDGKETCDRDPCAMVTTLREKGIDLTVHVVGFDVTGEESEQLQCIAEAGGGRYAGAGTAVELTAALGTIRETVEEEVREATESEGKRGSGSWRFKAGETIYQGKISFVRKSEQQLTIQLVNSDAVNFAMVLSGQESKERLIVDGFFAVARGRSCYVVKSEPPFAVKFENRGKAWLDGEFSGMLACPDFSALPVTGSFHIPAPGGKL